MQYLPLSAAFLLLSSTAAAQSFKVTPPAAGEYLCTLVPPVPVLPPALLPVVAARLPGLQVAANLDFGTSGNIRNTAELNDAVVYHDHWGTIANGTGVNRKYGCETAATQTNQMVAGVEQQVSLKVREITGNAIKIRNVPKEATQATIGPAAAHDCLSGSFMTRFKLDRAGAELGKDLVWETRMRMSVPVKGWWLAIWAAPFVWESNTVGPEMDVMESFSSEYNTPASAWGWHGDAIGATEQKPGVCIWDWPSCQTPWKAKAPNAGLLTDWHVWTYIYKRDNTFQVLVDGQVYISGKQSWKNSQGPQDMNFMIDCTLGQTQIADVKALVTPTAKAGLECEIDYTRFWLAN